VVWRGEDRVGFEFAPLDAEAQRLLRQICANLRLQPLAPLPPEPS
jgi:c-di-GMP-binding flagellar brake protein YcgR